MSISAPPFTPHFATLAAAYDVVLCDVWGVVHNSVVAFADACTALERFRAQGGTVVLITNAPRPSAVVMTILDELKVPRAAYDAIVSSGDVTRAIIAARAGRERLSRRSGAGRAHVRGPRHAARERRDAPTTWSAPACSTTTPKPRRTTPP